MHAATTDVILSEVPRKEDCIIECAASTYHQSVPAATIEMRVKSLMIACLRVVERCPLPSVPLATDSSTSMVDQISRALLPYAAGVPLGRSAVLQQVPQREVLRERKASKTHAKQMRNRLCTRVDCLMNLCY